MHFATVAQVGEAVGGAAGLAALVWNIVDTARRRKARRAPQLQALLTQIVALMDEIIKSPQDYDWCRERVEPVYRELDQLRPVLGRGVESKVSSLCAKLSLVMASGTYKGASVPQLARMSLTQEETAKEAVKLANSIRRKWADT